MRSGLLFILMLSLVLPAVATTIPVSTQNNPSSANPNRNEVVAWQENYVYADASAVWSSMIDLFSLNGDISNLAGETVKFRWFFKSTPTITEGSGIMIDDFVIYNDVPLAPPENLTATVDGNSVSLNWEAPGSGGKGGEEGWLHYDGEFSNNSVGTNTAPRIRPSSYRIYRDQTMINEVGFITLNYMDVNVPAGIHSYHVTAMFGTNESLPSASAVVNVLDYEYVELSHDDGSSELGFTVSPTHQMAVYYNHGSELTLKYAKVYLHNVSPSSLIVRAQDVGGDGMPGDNLAQVQYPVSSQVQGWNHILFPEIVIPGGAFYLSILVIPNPSSIGLDTDNSGHSYVKMGSNAAWEAYTEGEIMIRAIVETSSNAITQNIALTGGWNLVSLNVSPSDHTLPTLLAPISSQIQQVKGTEGIYIPGNPYSTLSTLTDGKGYNIQVTSNVIWNVVGDEIPVGTPLPLADGWNLTAYLPRNCLALTTALQSISTWIEEVKGTDGVYIPDNPYSTLFTLYPDKGYWIKLTGAHSLVYPIGRGVAPVPVAVKPLMNITQLPASMVLLARCDWASPADMLDARDDKEVSWAQEFITPEGFPAALLQIYTESSKEEISLWLLRADGSEVELANRFTSQPNATLGSYPVFINLEPKSGDPEVAPLPTRLYDCYPNPFNPDTTISFNLAEENAMVSINIYNLKGQRVRRLTRAEYTRGKHSLLWNGADDSGRTLSSGIYMIKLQAGKYRKTVKALMSK